MFAIGKCARSDRKLASHWLELSEGWAYLLYGTTVLVITALRPHDFERFYGGAGHSFHFRPTGVLPRV